MTRALTPKQARFVQEYLVDLNATQAAIRAGYSSKTAYSIASENLRKPEIILALQEARQRLTDRLTVTPESVLREYARLAFASMERFATWDGGAVTLKASSALSPHDTAAVAEISETRTEKRRTVRLKLHDKKGALDSLAKHLGLLQPEKGEGMHIQVVVMQYRPDGPSPAPVIGPVTAVRPSNGQEGPAEVEVRRYGAETL
jgi:phage terminase small subunit